MFSWFWQWNKFEIDQYLTKLRRTKSVPFLGHPASVSLFSSFATAALDKEEMYIHIYSGQFQAWRTDIPSTLRWPISVRAALPDPDRRLVSVVPWCSETILTAFEANDLPPVSPATTPLPGKSRLRSGSATKLRNSARVRPTLTERLGEWEWQRKVL